VLAKKDPIEQNWRKMGPKRYFNLSWMWASSDDSFNFRVFFWIVVV